MSTNLEREEVNAPEDEQLLMKIYSFNESKINKYSKIVQIAEIIAFFSFLALLVILAVKLSKKGNFSYFYLMIPFSIALISALVALNTIFELKDLMDKAEIEMGNRQKQADKSSLTMKILINFTGGCLFVFSIVLFLRLDHYISQSKDINLVFIPFYFAILCSLIFAVFISPGFFKAELYFEIALTFIHLVSIATFFFLLCYKINSPNSMKYAHVFVPYYFSTGANLIYCIGQSFLDKPGYSLVKQISTSLSMVCIVCAGIIIQVFLDGGKRDNYFWPILLYIIAYLGFTWQPILNIFKESSDEPFEGENEDDH